jgi:hypothetical protein
MTHDHADLQPRGGRLLSLRSTPVIVPLVERH